jgi:DNA primase
MPDWNSVLLQYGVDVPYRSQFNIHCPFHEDRKESCAINVEKGVWVCFAGCGQGSLRYFIWKLSGKPWNEITDELETQTWELDFSLFDDLVLDDSSLEPYQPPVSMQDVPSNHWIYRRGFTYETLVKWGCKSNEYSDLLIPIEDQNSTTLGWLFRRQQATPKYLFSKGFQKSKSLFGINHLYSVDTLYVVEGALDAMWLDQHGYSSVAVLGASISSTQINLIGTLHPSEVVLSLDNDDAGRRGISKATLDMSDRFLLSYLNLPKEYKDVQEIRDRTKLTKVLKNTELW